LQWFRRGGQVSALGPLAVPHPEHLPYNGGPALEDRGRWHSKLDHPSVSEEFERRSGMPFDQKAIVAQIDAVLQKCDLRSPAGYHDFSDNPKHAISEAVNLLFSAIERLAPPGSVYRKNAKAYEQCLAGNIGLALQPLRGILRALRTDYEMGNLLSVVELVHADIFADFLEMADYLLQQGYKDPAAVVMGSVLEENLRKQCDKHGILTAQASGTPKKADLLNSELAAAGAYSKLDQKSITSWLDLRNKAAHGKYSEYTNEQVVLTLHGVRDFVGRYPA
jgi:hypothetical protein